MEQQRHGVAGPMLQCFLALLLRGRGQGAGLRASQSWRVREIWSTWPRRCSVAWTRAYAAATSGGASPPRPAVLRIAAQSTSSADRSTARQSFESSSTSRSNSAGPSTDARNSESRSRSGSGAPIAILTHKRVAYTVWVASTAIEFVASPAGRQFSASTGRPSIDERSSFSDSPTRWRADASTGSVGMAAVLYYTPSIRTRSLRLPELPREGHLADVLAEGSQGG